ncbi:MAG: hypothetical protein A2Z57_01645 [Planctomycetes bacterium RIFCSPHIGHO2_12_39_6]|nr:MAG: hypothetical protein A2Z57_01645 [Planctomycetes bacterium RIFCSPHIGHO2_12_39_6]
MSTQKLVGIFVGLIFLGVICGFILSLIPGGSKSKTTSSNIKTVVTQKSAGVKDKENFKDTATGILKEGGMDGEGNFHLERPGGKSQNVYLTSSTVDLAAYLGHKVTVWGETFSAEKAGWLMDVGAVEVLD